MRSEVLTGEYTDYKEISNELLTLNISPINIKKIIIYYEEDED